MFKFKSLVIIITVALFSITAMVSCDKGNNTIKDETSINNTTGERAVGGVGLKIKGKPYRATSDRPRDHKNCGCSSCFGLCEVSLELDIDFTKLCIITDPNGNSTRVYFLEELSNFDTEFGIDNDIAIPKAALEKTKIKSLTLLNGIYTFVKKTDKITINGEGFTTFGYVDVSSK